VNFGMKAMVIFVDKMYIVIQIYPSIKNYRKKIMIGPFRYTLKTVMK